MARKKKTLITYEVFIRRSGKETVLLTTTDKKAAEKAYRQNRGDCRVRVNGRELPILEADKFMECGGRAGVEQIFIFRSPKKTREYAQLKACPVNRAGIPIGGGQVFFGLVMSSKKPSMTFCRVRHYPVLLYRVAATALGLDPEQSTVPGKGP